MVPTYYTPSSAKEHFEKVKYILNEYPFFTGSGSEYYPKVDMIFKSYEKLIEETTPMLENDMELFSPFPAMNYLIEDMNE